MKVILIPLVVILAGCGSVPRQIHQPAKPACYGTKDVTIVDGKSVASQTIVRCTDDPIESIPIKRMGVAPKCFEHPYKQQLPNGRIIEGINYACQKRDGSWEVIDGRGINR